MNSVLKYTLSFCTLFIISNVNLKAQSDSSIAKNTIFVEGFGNGIIGSVNYDRIIFIKKLKFSCRIGFVYLPTRNESLYSIPFELNFLKGRKNNIELGLGLTYAYGFNSSSSEISQGSNFITKEEYSRAFYFVLKPIGYRFQKKDGGIFVKVNGLILYKAFELNKNYTQRKNEFILGPYFGLSLGYTFKNK